MKLPKLNESVILIDAEFLISMIKENYVFYTDLYKDRTFPPIRLADIINIIASTSRILQENEKVNVIFFSKLGNDTLPNTIEPNCLFEFADFTNNPIHCEINKCTFEFAYYYADPEMDEYDDEKYCEEFGQLLVSAAYDHKTFNISIVADNDYYYRYLVNFDANLEKSFVIYRGLYSTLGIDSPKFSSVTFDYVIAMCMGLKKGEW